jgi:hypothetical protein
MAGDKKGKALGFSVLLFSLLSPVFAAANTELVDLGKGFANDVIGPLLAPLAAFGFNASTGYDLIQFFAAFVMIYFVITQMRPDASPLMSAFITVIFLGGIHFFIKLDWYTMLVHLAPAALAFLVMHDALSFIGVISERTAKWVAFMSMVLVFWTDYAYFVSDNGIFGYFFSRIFGTTYSYFANPITLIIAALLITGVRIFAIVTGSMKQEAARQYQLAYEHGAKYLQQKVVSGDMGKRP